MPEKKNAKKTAKKEEKGFFITRTARKVVEGYNEKVVKPVVQKGKKVSGRVRTDAGNAVNSMVEKGRKMLPEIPGAKTVEKKINSGIDTAVGFLNLPTKTDIENLTVAMENLSRKMDGLADRQSA